MDLKLSGLGLFAALVFASGAGCNKSEPKPAAPTAPSASPALSAETVARVHWLGKTRLSLQANAVSFMRIWSLPQSAGVEAQALDKFSLAPWRLLRGDSRRHERQRRVVAAAAR